MSTDEDILAGQAPDKLFFRIGEAAQLVGVEPHVLRYWEGEFKLRPRRSDSGQRMYRRKDIAQFLRIRELLHTEGFTIAGARKAMQEPGESSTADPVSTGRVREASERIARLRERVAEARRRFSTVGVAGPEGGS